jgi:hypothetical protein
MIPAAILPTINPAGELPVAGLSLVPKQYCHTPPLIISRLAKAIGP